MEQKIIFDLILYFLCRINELNLKINSNISVHIMEHHIFYNVNHRYQKIKNRLLKVCYVPATSAGLPRLLFCYFDVAVNSTKEANKAGGMRH
jgi:hypothetical protein